jgi:hypothetical protein
MIEEALFRRLGLLSNTRKDTVLIECSNEIARTARLKCRQSNELDLCVDILSIQLACERYLTFGLTF